MRKLLLLLFMASAFSFTARSQAYKIQLKTNYDNGIAYLAYYLGPKLYIQDSAAVAKNGNANFTGAAKLIPGVYSIVMPGKRYSYDFLVDKDQDFEIEFDSTKPRDVKVTGNAENEDFVAYQRFTQEQGVKLNSAKEAYSKATTRADSSAQSDLYEKYNKELNEYRQNIVTQKSGSLLALLLSSMKETPIPNFSPKNRQDSLDAFNYYKKHYWDSYSFMDDRIIRTPFFLPKLENWYRNVIAPMPNDSIIADIDYKLLLARNAPELYKYMINWITDEYFNPKLMGQDAIFLHMYNKYHSKGISNWLNESQLEQVNKRAYMIMGNQVGITAANLNMESIDGKRLNLAEIDAPYTVVAFWDPDCGHCKEEMPRVDSIYRSSWKAKGIKIFAVNTGHKIDDWKKFVAEHKMDQFINVYQPEAELKNEEAAGKPGYRQLYDITSTPTLYLLDKDKKIVAKKLTFLQINDLIEFREKNGSNANPTNIKMKEKTHTDHTGHNH